MCRNRARFIIEQRQFDVQCWFSSVLYRSSREFRLPSMPTRTSPGAFLGNVSFVDAFTGFKGGNVSLSVGEWPTGR